MRYPLRAAALVLAPLLGAACGGDGEPDAYGNFEAEEVVVSAQAGGPIARFEPVEGALLAAGAVVAVIDTVPLSLEREQLVAQRRALAARRTEASAQLAAIEAQRGIADRAFARTTRLAEGQAATAAQLDQAEREVKVLAAQGDAARAASASLGAELAALDARLAIVADRLGRATVVNPVAGTVLATYARAGETAQPGQALYKVAALDTLILRAYVSGDQLAAFRLGQEVRVHADGPDGLRAYPGTVSWVSAKAEFTPTPVQTRSERAELVYAIKVRVANRDGALKIGMPGDLTLGAPQ